MNSTPYKITNSELASAALSLCKKQNGRLKNWTSAESSTADCAAGKFYQTNHGRYSRSCTYNRYSYTPLYTSRIWEEGGIIHYQFGFGATIKTAKKPVPAGMKFEVDSLGVKLVRVSDGLDYHFTGDHFLHRQFASNARLALAKKYRANVEENKHKRAAKKNEAQQVRFDKIFNRDLKNTYVNLNDSRAAGNCVEGSLRFAEIRLKMNREDILRGGHLCLVNAKKLVETRDERAIRAAKRAWARETTVCI